MKAYFVKHRAERKQRALDYLGGKCVACGTQENLEFDHIIPETWTFRIGTAVWGRKWEDIELELKKCQLLCNPCHLLKTASERPEPQHGTQTMYGNHKCRCADCRRANTDYHRNRRSLKKL